MNSYSEGLLSKDWEFITGLEEQIAGRELSFSKFFNQCSTHFFFQYSEGVQQHLCLQTLACFLAAMSQEDIDLFIKEYFP